MQPGPTDLHSSGAPPSEGDVNHSAHRQAWTARYLSAQTQARLDEDAQHFLHQSLSEVEAHRTK